jgi:excisionase family DNA binding protein
VTDSPELLTAAEVAKTLRVSTMTVYRWGQNGTLPSITVGGTIRFRRSDVDALLESDGVA